MYAVMMCCCFSHHHATLTHDMISSSLIPLWNFKLIQAYYADSTSRLHPSRTRVRLISHLDDQPRTTTTTTTPLVQYQFLASCQYQLESKYDGCHDKLRAYLNAIQNNKMGEIKMDAQLVSYDVEMLEDDDE